MANDPPLQISLFELLRSEFQTTLQPIRCTKATLVHLSHTLEDLVLSHNIPALLFTGFQESSHWREETQRYRALADVAQQVCIFAGGKLPPESSARELHITLRGEDPLRQEWFLALLSPQFTALLCGQDRQVPVEDEATRQFDTIFSFDPVIINRVLDLLEQVIGQYRPERLERLQQARHAFPATTPDPTIITLFTSEMVRFEEQLQYSLNRATTALNQQLRWRDDLTATLVHDMRTPLQSLALAIEMLEQGDQFDQKTVKHMLNVAKRGTHHLKDIVQLILDTNQLAAGQMDIGWQPIPLESFITTVCEQVQPFARSHKLELIHQIDPRVSLIWGDQPLLARVLENLLSNAVKFTSAGGKIHLGVAPAPSSEEIELRVRDTGEGIDPKALPHIFDRYYQVRENDRKGSGLGLYFCRLAVEAHGGSIRAVSKIGDGTTITVVLPATPPLD